MDKEVNYSGITRRIVAYTIDSIVSSGLILLMLILVRLIIILGDIDSAVTGTITIIIIITFLIALFIIFNVFMIVRFGGTPGQLLLKMRVKDKNTLENITVGRAIIRYFSFLFWLSTLDILSDECNLPLLSFALLILILIFAVRDKRKQALHDKIAKTVVINYKPDSIAQESDSVS